MNNIIVNMEKDIKKIIASSINLCAITYIMQNEDQNITPEDVIEGIDVLIANCEKNEENYEFCAKLVKAKEYVKKHPNCVNALIQLN